MHPTRTVTEAGTELEQVTRELLDEWGIDARRVRSVVCELADGDWHTPGQLVRDHALSRRTVARLAARLRPWLDVRGDGLRVQAGQRDAVVSAWGCTAAGAPPAEQVEATMAALMRGLPPSDRSLDHVPATPATAVRRARFLLETFELRGACVVCLGDHDLTSLALALCCPEADVSVVDVDERILTYVGAVSAERGLRVRPLFADLRVALPPSLREACDLVFTDPPYTPSGVGLFLARGVEALRRRDAGRLVFCYGYGERHPALGLKVQSVFHGMHLVAEAVLPGFNRYAGAEALGGASSLYVCRPTRRTSAAIARPRKDDPRIYSRGESAETAGLDVLPPAVVDQVRILAGGGEGLLLVGEGWPDSPPGVLPLRRFLDDLHAAYGKPPFTGPPHAGVVAVNLHPHFASYLPRVLLTAAARRLVAVVTPDAAGALVSGRLADLVGIRYRLTQVAAEPPLVVADRVDAAPDDRTGRALAALLGRPAATFGSAWREALIAALAAEGRVLTKNEARAAIATTRTGARYGRCHLSELPVDRLRDLSAEVERSLAALV